MRSQICKDERRSKEDATRAKYRLPNTKEEVESNIQERREGENEIKQKQQPPLPGGRNLGPDLILEHVFTANKSTTFSPPLYPLCFTLSSSLLQAAQRGSSMGHTTDIQATTITTAAHATHHDYDEKRTKERCHTQRNAKTDTLSRHDLTLSRHHDDVTTTMMNTLLLGIH